MSDNKLRLFKRLSHVIIFLFIIPISPLHAAECAPFMTEERWNNLRTDALHFFRSAPKTHGCKIVSFSPRLDQCCIQYTFKLQTSADRFSLEVSKEKHRISNHFKEALRVELHCSSQTEAKGSGKVVLAIFFPGLLSSQTTTD